MKRRAPGPFWSRLLGCADLVDCRCVVGRAGVHVSETGPVRRRACALCVDCIGTCGGGAPVCSLDLWSTRSASPLMTAGSSWRIMASLRHVETGCAA